MAYVLVKDQNGSLYDFPMQGFQNIKGARVQIAINVGIGKIRFVTETIQKGRKRIAEQTLVKIDIGCNRGNDTPRGVGACRFGTPCLWQSGATINMERETSKKCC